MNEGFTSKISKTKSNDEIGSLFKVLDAVAVKLVNISKEPIQKSV